MKIKPLVLIIIIMAVFAFCHKDNYMSEGIIIGPDLRDCACCGGWYIKIDTTTYEFESLPANSKIDLQNEQFPIIVSLNWQLSQRAACPSKFIDILAIRKE